jgi:plastocyanin
MFAKSFIVSALMGFAAAQSASSALSISASESLASQPMGVTTHTIQVGGPNGSLAFFPNNIKAAPGDMVQFQFHPKVRTRPHSAAHRS